MDITDLQDLVDMDDKEQSPHAANG